MSAFLPFLLGNLWRTAALALLVCLGIQALALSWARDARDVAIAEGAVATAANESQHAMIETLVAQRDALLLARAQDVEVANQQIREALNAWERQQQQLRAANARIKELAKRPACQAVMSAAICPEIERELRKP